MPSTYFGSMLLLSFSKYINVPIDQVNFIVSQLLALLFGYLFKRYATPRNISPIYRHLIQIVLGIFLCMFCYGRDISHIILQSALSYCVLLFGSSKGSAKCVLVLAMAYLSLVHIWRMISDYGNYRVDISIPLMVNTQKLTSLAFNIYDGRSSHLTEIQKKYSIKELPRLIEFLSYLFSFQFVICGPFTFFSDYIKYIHEDFYDNSNKHYKYNEIIGKNLFCCFLYLYLATVVSPHFHLETILDNEFKKTYGLLDKLLYILLVTTLQRQKYYFAWKLSETINIISGYGFKDIDKNGVPKWDLVCNANVYYVETSTSIKQLLDNWNKMTLLWLRYVVYERWQSAFLVFMFSSIWHGFYAGYFIMFFNALIFQNISRLVHKKVTPHFQHTMFLSRVYNIFCFIHMRILTAYLFFPFIVLEFQKSVDIYNELYWCFHILAFFVVIVMIFVPSSIKSK